MSTQPGPDAGTLSARTQACAVSAFTRIGSVTAAFVALALSLTPVTGGAQGALDAKAELLLNIARFVEWPESKDQLTFAVLGDDDLAAVVASTLSTKTLPGRKLYVRCIRRPEDARDCQVLFIAPSEADRIPQVVQALEGHSVLTVADTPGFTSAGGMVDFVQENERVRFEINLGTAEKARLKISAKLLALARIVAANPEH